MIVIDTDGAPLDPADRFDGDYVFGCDTAAGPQRVHVCLGPFELTEIEDAAGIAQDAAEARHGVVRTSGALFEGYYERGL